MLWWWFRKRDEKTSTIYLCAYKSIEKHKEIQSKRAFHLAASSKVECDAKNRRTEIHIWWNTVFRMLECLSPLPFSPHYFELSNMKRHLVSVIFLTNVPQFVRYFKTLSVSKFSKFNFQRPIDKRRWQLIRKNRAVHCTIPPTEYQLRFGFHCRLSSWVLGYSYKNKHTEWKR